MAGDGSVARLWSSLSEFGSLGASGLDHLAGASTRLVLRRGDTLIREGEASADLYFLVSGRLAVFTRGSHAPVAEIAQGQPIGEVGFFGRMPRTATVVAVRDSTVLRLSRERFDEISRTTPELHDHVLVTLARRLARTTSRTSAEAVPIRTMAVLPAGEGAAHLDLAARLRRELSSTHDNAVLDGKEIGGRFGATAVND